MSTADSMAGDNSMDAPGGKERDQQQASDSPQQGEHTNPSGTGSRGPAAGPDVVQTDDPLVKAGPEHGADGSRNPDRTMVVETSRIRTPNGPFNPNVVMVPIESEPAPGCSGTGQASDRDNQGHEGGRKDQNGKGNHKQSSAHSEGNKKRGDEHGESTPRNEDNSRRQSSQPPSLTKILLFAGILSLVCGVASAWAFSHFMGSSKSDDQKSSGKNSGSGKDSGSSAGGDSDESSDAAAEEKKAETEKLLQAQAAWLSAMKELHDAQDAEHAARREEADTKAVLDFLKNTLLSAGRPGGHDASLAQAFWAGGEGKDVTLRQALDEAEARVSEAFADRPLGEAMVREMLGLAYLNLSEPARAVKQYERAIALREAMQGITHPDTAACRNQLAVAYRLAHLTTEASRLFDQNPNSPSHAEALAVRGQMLLLEKKPAEAELKLRECLTIRQKFQPDDWKTFDTRTMIGEALMDQGKYAEAEPLMLSGYEGMKQRENTIPPQEKGRIVKALERLVRLYDGWGKKDMAIRWRMELEVAGGPKKP